MGAECVKPSHPHAKRSTRRMYARRSSSRSRTPQRAYAVIMAQAAPVFCLEPPGMARIRKGVIDAILLGCIPILFITTDEFTKLWPLHCDVGSWGGTVLSSGTCEDV